MGELLIAERQDLQDIADKLKAKTGKTDGMSFPNGFKEAIDELGQGGGIDTSDANATSKDILKDKTVYVNGEKIVGIIETYGGSYSYDGEVDMGVGKSIYVFYRTTIDSDITEKTIEYSDEITITDGNVSLKSPSQITFHSNSTGITNDYDSILGKYVQLSAGETVFYVEPEAIASHNTYDSGFYLEKITVSPAHAVVPKLDVELIPELYELFVENYSVDTVTYPYVCVLIDDSNDCYIYFTKTIVVDGNKIGTLNSYYFTGIIVDNIPTTLEDLVAEFVNYDGYIDDEPHLTSYGTVVGKVTNFIDGDSEYHSCKAIYTNFDHNIVGSEITMRLDE